MDLLNYRTRANHLSPRVDLLDFRNSVVVAVSSVLGDLFGRRTNADHPSAPSGSSRLEGQC